MSADLKQTVVLALVEVAPEADMNLLRGDLPLRDQLDIDSMDFLNFLIGIHERTGIEIPESDYAELMTLDGCVDYLERHGRLRDSHG